MKGVRGGGPMLTKRRPIKKEKKDSGQPDAYFHFNNYLEKGMRGPKKGKKSGEEKRREGRAGVARKAPA